MASITRCIEVDDVYLVYENRKEYTLRCGTHSATIIDYGDVAIMLYQIGDNLYENVINPTLDGLNEGVWEWLCTLDRATDGGMRHLPQWFDTPFCKVSEGA